MSDVKVNGAVYRPQFRKCGNPRCKCVKGQGHGPYWYKFDGNGPGKYVGKELPDSIKQYEQALKANLKKIHEVKKQIEKRRDDAFSLYSQSAADVRTLEALVSRDHVDPKVLEKLGFGALALKGDL
jgi:hypothetical protein